MGIRACFTGGPNEHQTEEPNDPESHAGRVCGAISDKDTPQGTTDTGNGEKNPCFLLSRTVSFVLHPFIIPAYAILIMLYGDTYISFLPGRVKLFLLLAVLVNTFLIPALCTVCKE